MRSVVQIRIAIGSSVLHLSMLPRLELVVIVVVVVSSRNSSSRSSSSIATRCFLIFQAIQDPRAGMAATNGSELLAYVSRSVGKT